jgi:hypothetical protein
MRKRFFLAALVMGAALGALGTRLAKPKAQTSAPAAEEGAPSNNATPEATLAEELAQLRRRVASMERARGKTEGTQLEAAAATEASQQAKEALQEKVKKYYTPQLEAKLFTSYFAGLDDLRRAEGIDLPWARGIQASVRRSLQSGSRALATLQVPSVECGRTLCRMELASTDETTKGVALSELLQSIGPELPEVSDFVPTDSNEMTAYFARPGANLPPMPSAEDLVADLP